MSSQIVLIIVILIGAGFVLATLGRRKDEQLRNDGVYPPEGRETQADIDRLIQLGHKIQAIKVHRKLHGVGLKEAKEAVERRRSEIGVKLIAFLAIFLSSCGPTGGPVASMSGEELAARIEAGNPPIVLDVRTPEEYAAGHIPGAVNIPHDELGSRLDELGAGKTDEIVVHCQSGRRAATAEEVLAGAGYTTVRDLDGHMRGWQDARLPIE